MREGRALARPFLHLNTGTLLILTYPMLTVVTKKSLFNYIVTYSNKGVECLANRFYKFSSTCMGNIN